MPAIGANGGIQRGASLPRIAPRPAPAPRVTVQAPSLPPLLNTRAVHASAPAPVHTNTTGGSDAATSGPGYGSPEANRYKATPAYHAAVKAVFNAQPPPQKAAIIKGITSRPGAYNTPEGKAVLEAWRGMGVDEKVALAKYLPHGAGVNVGGALSSIYHSLLPQSVDLGQIATGKTHTPGEAALTALGAGAGKLIDKIPTNAGMSLEQRGISRESGVISGGDLLKNAGKDLVNLPAEALPSVSLPIEHAVHGEWGQALHSVIDPYVQAIRNPGQAITQHPLNTYLMFAGPGHVAARGVDTGVSLARTGHLPDVKAEPVYLTANLTHERPDFSKSPITRFSQKQVERQMYKRDKKGRLVPRREDVRGRLIRLETSRMVGQNERVRVAHRQQQIAAHAEAVVPGRGARAAHAVRTAAKYNPDPALIPGANVLSLIADGVIRRPDTVAADLRTHLGQIVAKRPNLDGFPKMIADHEAHVAEVQKALANDKFIRNPGPAFNAASRYANEYAKIQAEAKSLGHFNTMLQDHLDRRDMAHMVLTHMPGAHVDPERGLMVGSRPLSTAEMRAFVAKETGGRKLAFTSDRLRSGDSAFYVNGQKRPLPVGQQRNSYFAFEHGLTHPTHEALLEQRVRMQGIVDAHRSMNRLADQLLLQNERTAKPKAWQTYSQAQRDAPEGYVPIRLAQTFHPQGALQKAFDTGKVSMAALEEEAASRALDINARLQPSAEPGMWGVIDRHAAQQLLAHEKLISPGQFWRGWRGLTNQFRTVALATSFRHLPGVLQEQLLRAAAEGIGPISLLAGRAVMKRAQEIDPKLGEQRRIEIAGGGQASGQALALQTRQVARHFEGSLLHGPLSAFEKLMAAPGPRQIGHAWRSYSRFVLQGTKHVLEENVNLSAIGKQAIADFGGRHGLLSMALGTWGKMVDQAAHGVLDERTARQMGSYVRRVYGRWTDLTPGEQQALMFSPFGMWWTNSVAWLARMPIDHPAGAAFFAALNTGTEKERQQLGLDMFSPNHLPLYEQGSIPIGGKLWGANYYSAFGVANDPGEAFTSLLVPWQWELANAARGKDWKGETITSPANPQGRGKPPFPDIATVMANSLLSSFLPLYTKAQTIAEGGASKYDTSTLFRPQTKGPNPGPAAGLKKAVMPIRLSTPKSSGGGPSSTLPGGASGGDILPGSGGPSDILPAGF